MKYPSYFIGVVMLGFDFLTVLNEMRCLCLIDWSPWNFKLFIPKFERNNWKIGSYRDWLRQRGIGIFHPEKTFQSQIFACLIKALIVHSWLADANRLCLFLAEIDKANKHRLIVDRQDRHLLLPNEISIATSV